jgi:ABC-type transporter Mla subunit MlaD
MNRKPRITAFWAGVIAIVVIGVGCYFAFSGANPFSNPYELRAVFASPNGLRTGSPVRIAGVGVGQVTAVGRYRHTHLAVVTMELKDAALPIHSDASAKIRPRLFLEGSWFVDLRTGTPSTGKLHSGAVIPVTQTTGPVQLDQVLTSLQAPDRSDLQVLLQNYGAALTLKPRAVDDANGDPEVAGLTGAQAFNETYVYSPDALRQSTLVNSALLGTSPHDLSRLIAGLGRASAGLDANEQDLRDLLSGFNTTVTATAARAPQLQQAVGLLGPTVTAARDAFRDLDAALPATRAFAQEIEPGVRATPGLIVAARPWVAQAKPLLSDAELGGLLHELRPASANLAALTAGTTELLPQIDLIDRCLSDVVLPTGDVVVDDGPLSSGAQNYKEFWYAMVGLAGEGATFDGNGSFLRFATGGGGNTVETRPSTLTGEPLFGNAISPPGGTRPAYPARRPPYVSNVACYRNPVPDVNGPASRGPADQTVARRAP